MDWLGGWYHATIVLKNFSKFAMDGRSDGKQLGNCNLAWFWYKIVVYCCASWYCSSCLTITHKNNSIYYIYYDLNCFNVYKWCKILHTVHGKSGWTLSDTLPEDYESYIHHSCPDSEIRVPRIEQIPIDFDDCFCVDFSEAYGRPFFRTFCAGVTPWCGCACGCDGFQWLYKLHIILKATATTLAMNGFLFTPGAGLPRGRPTAVQPACAARYGAGKDDKGRLYYKDLATGSTSRDLPGYLDCRSYWERFGDLQEIQNSYVMLWHYQHINIHTYSIHIYINIFIYTQIRYKLIRRVPPLLGLLAAVGHGVLFSCRFVLMPTKPIPPPRCQKSKERLQGRPGRWPRDGLGVASGSRWKSLKFEKWAFSKQRSTLWHLEMPWRFTVMALSVPLSAENVCWLELNYSKQLPGKEHLYFPSDLLYLLLVLWKRGYNAVKFESKRTLIHVFFLSWFSLSLQVGMCIELRAENEWYHLCAGADGAMWSVMTCETSIAPHAVPSTHSSSRMFIDDHWWMMNRHLTAQTNRRDCSLLRPKNLGVHSRFFKRSCVLVLMRCWVRCGMCMCPA